MYGTVEWLSHRYPNKRYQLMVFCPEMYLHVVGIILSIPDYHTIVTQLHLKN